MYDFHSQRLQYKKISLVSLSIHALSMMVSCLVKFLQKDDVRYMINADFLTCKIKDAAVCLHDPTDETHLSLEFHIMGLVSSFVNTYCSLTKDEKVSLTINLFKIILMNYSV